MMLWQWWLGHMWPPLKADHRCGREAWRCMEALGKPRWCWYAEQGTKMPGALSKVLIVSRGQGW